MGSAPSRADDITGQASIIDGDTLEIQSTRRDFPMHARIGMLRALNRHVEHVFDPLRKDTHWGRRKLLRE